MRSVTKRSRRSHRTVYLKGCECEMVNNSAFEAVFCVSHFGKSAADELSLPFQKMMYKPCPSTGMYFYALFSSTESCRRSKEEGDNDAFPDEATKSAIETLRDCRQTNSQTDLVYRENYFRCKALSSPNRWICLRHWSMKSTRILKIDFSGKRMLRLNKPMLGRLDSLFCSVRLGNERRAVASI